MSGKTKKTTGSKTKKAATSMSDSKSKAKKTVKGSGKKAKAPGPKSQSKGAGGKTAKKKPSAKGAVKAETPSMEYRRKYGGLIGIESKVPIKDKHALSVIYTPGVGSPCMEIYANRAKSFEYTCRGNTIAILTDGSAVLGLGNVGARAALPVMEAKSVIFKTLSGIDAFPICVDTQDPEEIVRVGMHLVPTFGGIAVEDISAPRCFVIEEQLSRGAPIPVVHTDQHGTSIAVFAALTNALKIVKKKLSSLKVVISGAGAAGTAITRLLDDVGVKNIIVCDTRGAIFEGRLEHMNWAKAELARHTNPHGAKGKLADVIKDADVFVGVSAGNIVTKDMIQSMASDAIVFALASPVPEIRPKEAKKAGAVIVGSSLPEDVNEVSCLLAYPGLFRGALDVRARNVNKEMKLASAKAIASLVNREEISGGQVVPKPMDLRVPIAVSKAVAKAAVATGEARKVVDPDIVAEQMRRYLYEGEAALVEKAVELRGASLGEESIELHERYHGAIDIKTTVSLRDERMLGIISTPGAAEVATLIKKHPEKVFDYTCKGNLVAIVTDGSAVLGLGNIGPEAAMPVMEGKAVLFKTFAGVEAFPICVDTQDPVEIVEIVEQIAPTFGGINLEDISAPRCFQIERELKRRLNVFVFHDDQHGTAVVALAGLMNALKLVGKDVKDVTIAMNGAGAGGMAVAKLLLRVGVKDIVLCDRSGIIYQGRREGMNWAKVEMSKITNKDGIKGDLAEALKGRDVFIGLSAANAVSRPMVRSMAKDPIIFALANPVPEIMPGDAIEAGAKVVATGRSDLANQINNALAFPGIFRGALDTRSRQINDEMKIAAAQGLASLVEDAELEPEYIIPNPLDLRVPSAVAAAVAKVAISTGQARLKIDPDKVAARTREYVYEGRLQPLE
jgi:malate dehydrogenase (oxaloacetate-decarboxylating)